MRGNPELIVISLAFFLLALFILIVMIAPDFVEYAMRYFFGVW